MSEKKQIAEIVHRGDPNLAPSVQPIHLNEQFQPPGEPAMVAVKADMLLPLLGYMKKFFKSVGNVNTNGPSRLMDPRDSRLTLTLQGFTPEDFNALQSLNNSMGHELAELLDFVDKQQSPQMARTTRQREQLQQTQKNSLPRLPPAESGEGNGEK